MKKIVAVTLVCFTAFFSIWAQSNLQPIAEVKLTSRAPITLGQLKTRVTALEKEIGRKMTTEERKQALDGLINERLIVQAAEKDGVKIMDSEVSNYFSQYVSSQLGRQITEAEFIEIIKKEGNMSIDDYMRSQNGMTLAEFKTFLKTQLTAQAYVMQKKQKELQSLPLPTDAEIKAYYELNKQSFVQPDTVQLFLVVVPKEGNAAAAEKKIQELQKKLSSSGKAITDIRTKAQDKKAGYQAGEIFVSKTALAAQQIGIPMEELLKIFDMKQGAVSSIMETPINYQCFVVLDKKDAKILGLTDIVEPGSTVSLHDYIRNMVMLQRQNQALGEALAEITNALRIPANYSIAKKDAELDKVLSW